MKEKTGVPVLTPSDTPEMIRYCLACPWSQCWDCLGKKNELGAALRADLGGRTKWSNSASPRT